MGALRFSIVAIVSACTPFTAETVDAGDVPASPLSLDGGTVGDAGSDAATPIAKSCGALHTDRPDLATGIYSIDLDGDGPIPAVQVHCDMTIDGGGWTLVARSVATSKGATNFGWTTPHGSLTDDTHPYSLGTLTLGLAFKEVLLGARGTGKDWSDPVFKHVVPTPFTTAYTTTSFSSSSPYPTTVQGTCKPSGGPKMLHILGHTTLNDHFAFHDNVLNPSFGLFPDIWNTNGAEDDENPKCGYSAGLTGKPGMIAVR